MYGCKLVIQDEVNIKIENLPAEIRRKVSNALKFQVPYARFTSDFRLGRWDGKVAFFSVGGSGYLGHLDRIISVLEKNGYSITEIEDNRCEFKFDTSLIDENYWIEKDVRWPSSHSLAGQHITLRDYQVESINNFLSNPQSLQQIATGAGKCRAAETYQEIRSKNQTLQSLFSKKSKLQNPNGSVTITLEDIFAVVQQVQQCEFLDNVEVDISHLCCYVPTVSGWSYISHLIRKENLPGNVIKFSNGFEVDCAENHIFIASNKSVYAKDLKIGDYVDSIHGNVLVTQVLPSTSTTFYDFSISYPHVYVDTSGLIHHNTITTATLSNLVEKYGRSLIIVPNKSLVVQTEEDYINCGLDVGVYFGDRKDTDKTHTICTWQSLNILDKRNKDGVEKLALSELLHNVSAVIVDECFSEDTRILTPTGFTEIKDLIAGNQVINWCSKSQTFKIDTVVKIHKNLTTTLSDKMLKLCFENNSEIKVTENHKFLTKHGWVPAKELLGHSIVSPVHEFITVSSIVEIKRPDRVYNLEISNDHNYVAEDAVVANCHQAKADVLKKLLTTDLKNAPIRWGLSGTIPREPFEYLALYAGIGPVVGKITAKELQDKGVLANCHINIRQLLDLREFTDYQKELKFLVTDESRINYIAKMCHEISQTGNTLILIDRIQAGEMLHKLIPGSTFVKGDVKLADRKEAFDEINQGSDLVVIATYGVAAVGINIVKLYNVVLIEPGKSFIRVIQSIGRGLRRSSEKDFVNIWDITSSCRFSKNHLSERKKFYREQNYPFTIEKIDYGK